MDNTQLVTLVTAIFMTGANPLSPEDAAEKARDLVKAMAFAISFADDDVVKTVADDDFAHSRTEAEGTRRTYFD
jgi:hypothetical protein